VRRSLVVLFVALGSFAPGCGRSARDTAPIQPAFEIVRQARAKIEVVAKTRAEQATRQGAPAGWQDRLAADVKWLDEVADELEHQGAYGPPREEQADELQRLGYEIRQATECDPALLVAVMPALQDLERTSRRLRVFTLPPAGQDAPHPLATR
jgi:hypothetical protein